VAGRRIVKKAPAEEVQTVQQQIVKQDREEIRETIKEILQTGPDLSALKEIGPAPAPGMVVPEAPVVPGVPAAAAPPRFLLDALTELVVFFNRGPSPVLSAWSS